MQKKKKKKALHILKVDKDNINFMLSVIYKHEQEC